MVCTCYVNLHSCVSCGARSKAVGKILNLPSAEQDTVTEGRRQKGQRRLLSMMEESGCALLFPASCSKKWTGKQLLGTVFGLVTNERGSAYYMNLPAS